jgi:hypothetical protein
MSLTADNARAILIAALNSEHGIVVSVECPLPMVAKTLRAKQILYRFAKEDSDFRTLKIRLSPTDPDNQIWITKDGEPQNE